MRRRRRGTAENLDSLLDTMANVVGILVILLAVTQISVTQAMKRIRSEEGGPAVVDEATIAAAEEAASLAQSEAAALEAELAALAPEAASAGEELARVRQAAEEVRRRGLEAASLAPEEVERLIERRSRDVSHLEREIARTEQTLTSLQKQASEAPGPPGPKVARLPDPRPAPANAASVNFLCRYGRCFHVESARLFEQMEAGMRAALGTARVPNQLTPYELQRVIEHFSRNVVGTDELRLRFFNAGPRAPFGLRIDWRREGVGETDVELVRPGSDYRKAVVSRSPDAYYFKYFVWSDSFDAYLAARELASGLGYAAGWLAFPADADLFVSSGGLQPDRID